MVEFEKMREYLTSIGVKNLRAETVRSQYFIGEWGKGLKVFEFPLVEQMMREDRKI